MARIDIRNLANYFDITFDRAIRLIKFEVFNEAVRRTRVDTGRLRGNWQISDNKPLSGELDVKGSGGELLVAKQDEIWKFLNKHMPKTKTWFSNNLPYAPVINQKDGIVNAAVSYGVSIAKNIGNRNGR